MDGQSRNVMTRRVGSRAAKPQAPAAEHPGQSEPSTPLQSIMAKLQLSPPDTRDAEDAADLVSMDKMTGPGDALEMLVRAIADAGTGLTRLQDLVQAYRYNREAHDNALLMLRGEAVSSSRPAPVLVQKLQADTGRSYSHDLKRLDPNSLLHVLVPLLRLNTQEIYDALVVIDLAMRDAKPIIEALVAEAQGLDELPPGDD